MKHNSDTDRLRSFGRSYTKRLGLLARTPYDQSLSLLQSRIVFELGLKGETVSRDLVARLAIDKGYLSRSVSQLTKDGVIAVRESAKDKREKKLKLTAKGKSLFGKIDETSRNRARGFLGELGERKQGEILAHLASAQLLMGEEPLQKDEITIRMLKPGDIGWVIGRHGEIYFQEYNWNMDFETMVGEIAVSFARKHDTKKERAWIAEARGVRLGCVFLVRESEKVAKLRILLVDPIARGLGLGSLLVKECVRFARKCGYRKLVLWTNDNLHSARKIYVAEGFKLVREEPHQSFGHKLMGQYWELAL